MDELQCFLKVICFKAKVLKENVEENKINVQSGGEEGHVNVGAIAQDCEL
jgi:hypothetical protein